MKSPSQTKRHGQVTYAVALPHCAPVDRPGDHRTNPSHCNTQKASLPRPSPHAKPETFSRKIAGKAMKTMQSSPHVSLNLNADRRPQLLCLVGTLSDPPVNEKPSCFPRRLFSFYPVISQGLASTRLARVSLPSETGQITRRDFGGPISSSGPEF